MNQNNLTESDFDEMHEAAQRIFERLTMTIKAEFPTLKATLGRTTSIRFPMYSYITIEDANRPEIDPMVVGVDLRIDTGKILIQAHIIGEETGEAYFDLPNVELPFGTTAVDVLRVLERKSQALADGSVPVARRVFDNVPSFHAPIGEIVGTEAALK